MLDRESRRDRTLPTFITLVVLAFLMMTFDVRLSGGELSRGIRSGALGVIAPLQNLAATVIDPVADLGDTLAGLATLRAENLALRQEVARLQAELAGSQDLMARLQVLEELNDLEIIDAETAQVAANVIGRPDPFGASFIIDKGSDEGVALGHPVADPFGYVVGKVVEVSPSNATVVPITQDREAVTVLVDGQVGTLASRFGSDFLDLEVFDAVEPLQAGDLVVTSSVSLTFPQGLPVGEVIDDAGLEGTSISASVRLFADPDSLRVVVVITWPPEPGEVAVGTPTTAPPVSDTTPTSAGG
ncbi:MAG TPA: rod shape-determining protein MreC [Acidimicrobiia bacterium]|nr:rod shape-determining protein MreC [Acidimicrobiia bacterium]